MQKKYALVIDDEPEILEVLCYEIERIGLQTVRAANPTEARTRLGFHSFDLIVTDIMMPKESGIEFLASLLKTLSQKKVPIPPFVVVSAVDLDAETQERLFKVLKVGLFLQKPWDGKVLRNFIETKVFGRI